MVLPVVDLHQSYDDFRLDALLQYDLDDSERDDRNDNKIDHSSSHSTDLPLSNFDDIYDSISELDCDSTANQSRPFDRSKSGRKVLLREKSQRLFNNLSRSTRSVSSDGDVIQEKSRKCGFIQTLGMLIQRPNHETFSNTAPNHSKCKRGVVRKLSNRTEGTVLTYDDKSRTGISTCVSADDECSSVCYIESDHNSYTLADEWCNGMNCSTDTFESNDFDTSEMSKSDVSTRLYRSLPIIESRGLVSLLLDSDDDSECCTEEQTTVIDDSEKRQRPYTICDI
jgi:hypothetical protein